MNPEEQCEVSIRNCSGVPVLDIVGNLNKMALGTIESTIGSLVSAGHYHIVLNLKRAAAANVELIERLTESAQSAINHYGAIDVVAEANQLRKLVTVSGITQLFRLCGSENDALRRIKGLVRAPELTEQGCAAHVMEAK